MTLFDFKLLDYSEQVNLLHTEGVFVGKRKVSEYTVILFQLQTFYIEVYYTKYRKLIHHFNCGESTQMLNPYLEQIDVEDLVNIFD